MRKFEKRSDMRIITNQNVNQIKEELLVCIPDKSLKVPFRGFIPFDKQVTFFEHLLDVIANESVLIPRSEAENNPEYRQIVLYGVINEIINKYESAIYLAERTKKQTEGRLHNKIGFIGGHMCSADISDEPKSVVLTLDTAMKRELSEEVDCEYTSLIPFGAIYTDETEVDTVHLGIVYKIIGKVNGVNEDENMRIFAIPTRNLPEMVRNRKEEMETWAWLTSKYIEHEMKKGVWYV